MIDANLVQKVTTNKADAQMLLQLISGRKLGTTLNLRDVAFYLNQYITTENTPKAREILADYHQHLSDHKVFGFQPFARSPESEKQTIFVLGQPLRTTIGQLRFLSWCIKIGLLEHLNHILGHIKQQKRIFEAERKRKKAAELKADSSSIDHSGECNATPPEQPDDLVIRFSFD